jgi:hypothetical protein
MSESEGRPEKGKQIAANLEGLGSVVEYITIKNS